MSHKMSKLRTGIVCHCHSKVESGHLGAAIKRLKERHEVSCHRSRLADPEDLKEIGRLWRKAEPFFVTGCVTAPYDGCFYEPNIWLVTPPGCTAHTDLNAMWKPRYADPKGRLAALAAVSERARILWSAKWDLERALEPHMERFGDVETVKVESKVGESVDEMLGELDDAKLCLDLLRFIEAEVEPELQADSEREREEIDQKFPSLPDPPDSVVWPLYASGQGMAVDTIRSFADLVNWFANSSLPGDGRVSRLAEGWWHHEGFEDLIVHKWGPVSSMGPAEHYWAKAVEVAGERWGIAIPWLCEACGHETLGIGEGGAPHFTGYRGNGGIGVFMEGGLCSNCFDAGVCEVCANHGGNDHEKYCPEVAEKGLSICEWHAKDLLKGAVMVTPEADELLDSISGEVVELGKALLNEGQIFLPGIKPKAEFDLQLVRRFEVEGPLREDEPRWVECPIAGVEFDSELIEDRAQRMGIEIHAEALAEEISEGRFALRASYSRGVAVLAGHVAREAEVND